jgi:hypothetical protein
MTTEASVTAARASFVEALQSAYAARRGATSQVQSAARAYARALRVSGVAVGAALVDVKRLVREHTADDEPIFTPKVVGWAVAGYFAGTSRESGGTP